MKNKQELLIKSSEVKKGDYFTAGNNRYKAHSDAYQRYGVWTVDIDASGDYVYGWQQEDVNVKVTRITH